LLKYVLVSQYTDLVPDDLYPDKVRATFHGSTTRQEEDAKQNLEFQRETFGTEQLPLYVIVEPDGKGGFRVVDKYTEGKINNVSIVPHLPRPQPGARERVIYIRAVPLAA